MSVKSSENIHKKEGESDYEFWLMKSHQWPCNDLKTKGRGLVNFQVRSRLED